LLKPKPSNTALLAECFLLAIDPADMAGAVLSRHRDVLERREILRQSGHGGIELENAERQLGTSTQVVKDLRASLTEQGFNVHLSMFDEEFRVLEGELCGA
jgi:hypothetical protein